MTGRTPQPATPVLRHVYRGLPDQFTAGGRLEHGLVTADGVEWVGHVTVTADQSRPATAYGIEPNTRSEPMEAHVRTPYVNVVPSPGEDPRWRVHDEYILTVETQEQAIVIARPIAEQLGAEVTIHGEDGRIREKDSHGHDPKEIGG